jgi:hypothetical protein
MDPDAELYPDPSILVVAATEASSQGNTPPELVLSVSSTSESHVEWPKSPVYVNAMDAVFGKCPVVVYWESSVSICWTFETFRRMYESAHVESVVAPSFSA